DELKGAAVARRLRLREYVPVGEMIPGMAYLVRRLLENTSNESWLRAEFLENASPEKLLAPPLAASRAQQISPAQKHQLSQATQGIGDGNPFFTEPHHDWSDPKQRENVSKSIQTSVVPNVRIDVTVEQANAAIGRAQSAFP